MKTLRPVRLVLVLGLILTLNIVTLIVSTVAAVASLGNLHKQTFIWQPTDAGSTTFVAETVFFTGSDILRLLEPLINTPLYILIFVYSGIFHSNEAIFKPLFGGIVRKWFISQDNRYEKRNTLCFANGKERIALIIFFGFVLALYNQGAGYHSGSNLLKRPPKDLRDTMEEARGSLPLNSMELNDYTFFITFLNAFVHWSRDVWQHIISHYWYAIGGLILGIVNVIVYDNVLFQEDTYCFQKINEEIIVEIINDSSISPSAIDTTLVNSGISETVIKLNDESDTQSYNSIITNKTILKHLLAIRIMFYLNSIIYGVLVALVAIEFPAGTIVLFTIALVYGLIILGGMILVPKLYKDEISENLVSEIEKNSISNQNGFKTTLRSIGTLFIIKKQYPGRYIIGKTYFLGFLLAFIIIIIWIIVQGGFKSREQSGIDL